MYQPPHFREERLDVLHALIRERPGGLLVSHGGSGLAANLAPFVLLSEPGTTGTTGTDAGLGTLECHLSRGNAQWRELQAAPDCLVVFQGPQAYVTPAWYAAKREHGKVVPTWNYIVVQARGRAEVIEDPVWLRGHVERLTNHNEAPLPEQWLVSDAPEEFLASQLKGIVGIRFEIESLIGKWKLNQNRSEADRRGAALGLLARGGTSAEVGETMLGMLGGPDAEPSISAAARPIPVGADRFGEHRGLGVSTVAFKVVPAGPGDSLVIENTFHANGGPARHLHHEQDEWFYVLEGEFVIEVGDARHTLRPGDSLLAPRKVPHVWASVGGGTGRILVTFFPAGNMEAFFREVTKANAMPPQDPELWRAHGMELMGPPLSVP